MRYNFLPNGSAKQLFSFIHKYIERERKEREKENKKTTNDKVKVQNVNNRFKE